MTKLKRFTAFLLCLLMILPTQELTVLAETMSINEQIEEMLPSDKMEEGSGYMEEDLSSEPMEDGADRIKETLPLEPIGDETDRIEETLPLEPTEDGADRIKETLPLEPMEYGTDRIKKTLPLEPLDEDTYAIYWNPGGQLPAELATPSDATATASDASSTKARRGKDSANGLSPARPVKTLEKAIERAKKLMENKGLDSSDITIYAMNPMEVADGELYVLNAGNMRIASWPERPYQSDALFYVNGGQLTLMNVLLEAEDPAYEPDETELIYVRGGSLQMGQNVNINGCIIMDYNSELEDIKWKEDTATPSNTVEIKDLAAEKSEQMKKVLPFQMLFSNDSKVSTTRKASTASQAGKASFHIDNYRLDTSEENVELLEDRISASTWKEPIIELMEGFDGSSGEYLLKVRDDGRAESRELVTTLYADEATAEEFLDYFTLAESDNWSLQVETEAAAQLRDTGSGEESTPKPFAFEVVTLTSKTLIASRSLGDAPVVYWNPGPAMTVAGATYPAGDDGLYDGADPRAPLKTWEAAAEEAKKLNGVVVAMRTLDLGAEDASDYLTKLPSGEFHLASAETSLITPLGTWNATVQPAIIVPKDITLIIEDLYLGGMYDGSGDVTEAQTILVNEGDLIIEKNVRTEEKGYIQLNAFHDLKDHPIQVCSVDSSDDGDLRVFFGGINKNIAYRYVDVVVPGGDLAESIYSDADPAEKADSVGQALFDRVKLHSTNRSVANGGLSDIDWSLRQDTDEDDSNVTAQNIELYAIYYFDAIYIDGVNGDDANYGASCDYPVKTWARARVIWQSEMPKSLQARQDAISSMALNKIEADYPMPEVIYICNTVTVDSASEPEWKLESCYDYARGTDVKTEVVSHIDHIAVQGEGNSGVPRHEAPKTMIKVTGSGVLGINDIYIRNMVDDTDSVTIQVEAGGTLRLKGETTLNGTRLQSSGFTQKDLTLGNHVTVTGSGRFIMEADWTGSIENREQGVVAAGNGTLVEMNNGFIQKNNSYRADYYYAGITNHKAGGGVALSNGAQFTMNGGSIIGNETYQYGAGVYLMGAGTSFIMNNGKISDNRILTYYISGTNSASLYSQGAGIYAGTGTTVKIDNVTGGPEDTLISNNKAYLSNGTGIYADGILNINHATISDNVGGGISSIYGSFNYGVGIYVGENGTLAMNGGLVKGNHGAFSSYGNVKGAGIYFAAGTNAHTHTISDSTITENETGYEYNSINGTSYAQGGGIYLAAGNSLTITGSTVSKNRAGRGGGVFAAGSYGMNISLTLKETIIEENKGIAYNASSYGDSGGIYFYDYGTLTLEDGTKIINNSATQHTGGLYIGGSGTAHVYMMATTLGAIEISGNKITNTGNSGSYGGGITHSGGSWHAENVRISNNEAITQGGGIYSTSTYSYSYFRNMEISDNQAADGAALAISNGYYYMQDSNIVGNTATNQGGGIYLSSTGAYMYLSETDNGEFGIKDNHAAYGGGIAIANSNAFMMDITGTIQNSADVQGSNFYLNGNANIDILNGRFMQPDISKQVEGVYSIYINNTSTSVYSKYFDFSKITAEKKAGAHPDVILLNTGSSYLSVLAAPSDNTYGAFPISVNKEAFQSGSVLLKPSGITSRTMLVPNPALSGTTPVIKTYSALLNAAGNLDCYRGGELPRRSELGGFKDATYSNWTNVIIVGQGVYLDGTNGTDSNGGSSPEDAVATFDKAKDVLKERIEAAAMADSSRPEDEREGFAPFIYICGQVKINTNEDWALDYEAALYTSGENKYYAIAEERNGDPVYEPQVRRFASFVKQPMIKVGTGSNTVSFTTGRLIIDGMADKVIMADQSSSSPVIYGSVGTHVILTGDSMIRNNYYSALDIYGELMLNSENGDVNKQLYNNQSQYTVRLYGSAKMLMLGDSKIITDNTVSKIGSFTSYGIYIVGTDVSVSMEESSAIIQGPGATLLDGGLIYSVSANAVIKMKDSSRLEVGDGVANVLYSSGNGSKIEMSGSASIAALAGAHWEKGIYMGDNNSLVMSGQANITYGGAFRNTTYGVYMYPASTATASVKMQDDATIMIADTATSGPYWYYGISAARGESLGVELLNKAKITGNRSVVENYTAGINVNSAKNTKILLKNDVSDSVSITDLYYGIYIDSAINTSVSMEKNALISKCTYGIDMTYITNTNPESKTDISMQDDSKICNSDIGIYFYTNCDGPINIKLKDHASIEQNGRGISDYQASGTVTGPWRLNVEMYDDTRISGNSGSGIQLMSLFNGWSESTGYQKITLNDNAIIGGSDYFSSTDATSGNKGSGIYANGPIQLTMNGTAKISRNGTNVNSGTASSGIYLTRSTTANYHRPGTARITLNDSASICDNKGGGVYAETIGNSTTSYHNEVIIDLNGIKADGSLSTPSIQGNTDALYLGTDTTLKLKGEALVKINDSPYASGSYVARAIDNYGYIELDGRSTVDGLIYMNNGTRPITMTHGATGSASRYDLHLAEGFTGNIVVKPDGNGITDLTGASSQLAYYNKVSADGTADGRPIIELSPNLVLRGDNNVYLSGNGKDENTGNSPSTAVRTFEQARKLLRGSGYYTTGANIIICGSTVNVLSADDDWSFDSGGFVTNTQSGDTWQPIVTRYKGYGGALITLYDGTDAGYASNVTFKNITIDGGSANGIVLTTAQNDELLLVGRGRTAVLGEGAVLQNNKAVTTAYNDNSALGVRVYGGTLEINGGTIQNIVRETNGTFYNYWFASTVTVQGVNATYPGNLIMKSGQIINNELNAPNAYTTNARIGTIYLTGTYSNMEMRGGLIENNKVVSRYTNPAAAGAIVNYEGSVTISGGIIRGNEGGYGSAIYHYGYSSSSKMSFSGGQISGNTTNASGQQSTVEYSPIYVMQNGFELYGGGADIRDSIYLNQTSSAIKVSDSIYQAGRSYRVYLNFINFKKGSVVVEPDGNKVTNVTSYLQYFDVRSNPYVLDQGRTSNLAGNMAGVQENQCLILMKAVYLDSVNGNDANNGLKPSKAIKSFDKAKSVGESTTHGTSKHYVIYVCDKAINIKGESVWELPETAYMCRYTGFPVYESNGSETQELEREYHGCLIQPGSDLTFKDITIQGRRNTDSTEHNGDSLVNILSGVKVTVENGAVFMSNHNNGNYIAEDGFSDSLASNGGAFQVAEGGKLTINGGEIKGNSATDGSAIYLHASKSNPLSLGQLYLTGSPVISGKVYLNGTADKTSAYIQPDAFYVPLTPLQISVSNDYNGRPLIKYSDGTIPGEAELNHYTFDDAIKALYDIVNNSTDASILELSLRRVIYLDGQSGSDDLSHDGATPEKAFKTLKRTFEAIGNQSDTKGVLVYVVGTLDIVGETDIQLMNIKVHNGDGTYHYEGYYRDLDSTVNIQGQVYFKRYSQPQNYDAGNPVYDGYGKVTLLDSLFNIDNGGTLTLSGIYLDGHSIRSDSINPTLLAPAVVAQSPLITVKGSGTLQCNRAEEGSDSIPTVTMFINNVNEKIKNTVVGQLNGSDIIEGSSAGIELLDGGTCNLEYTEFANLSLGDHVISGGTDVYSNGDLHFSRYTNFGGSVFLEGLGTKDTNHETSRYLTVDVQGKPVQNKFQVMMRDPYVGRDVVHYQVGIEATANDAGYYLLEERVKDFFYLSNRKDYPHILELNVPAAVYIDGAYGIDGTDDRIAGSTPKTPVKTLRRAFELLKTRGGNTIYVVGTIQVGSDIQVTGMSYVGNDGNVTLGSTNKVNIVRYMQPDFVYGDPTAAADAKYDVDDYTGVLLSVRDGATARFSANVYFDGHSKPKNGIDLPIGAVVSRNGEAKAPLITVEKGGTLNLLSDVALFDNNNTYADGDSSGQHGGAISNSGTTIIDGALFKNNVAAKGSVAYQDGTFTIKSAPENLADNPKAFYLTTENTGTPEQPVWGDDHVIQTAVAIPDGQSFDIDMYPERAVAGRDVVRFTNNSAYNPNADAEQDHFHLGHTVPEELFLVEAENDPDVLELQDWEVLKVEVPADIYLVVCRKGSYDSTNKLMGVISDPSAGTDLFTAPEYTIKNKGSYDAKVFISGFENKTIEEGIITDPSYLMNLTASAATATTENDLYLAVKGLDDISGGTGFDIPETSLQPYAESSVTAASVLLGTLKTQTSGNFTFVGAVGSGFVDKFMDAYFPIEGSIKTEVQKYMDGTSDSGVINARAKYLLKYKVVIDPSRRTP